MSIIRKGAVKKVENNIFKPKPNTTTRVVLMGNIGDLASVQMHEIWSINPAPFFPCIKSEEACPGCEMGNKDRYRGYFPVIVDGEPKIWILGINLAKQLSEIAEVFGELEGQIVIVKRNGSGMKTTYMITPTGKTEPVDKNTMPDFLPLVGPMTRASIIKLLADRGAGVSTPVTLPDPVPETDIDDDDSELEDDDEWAAV